MARLIGLWTCPRSIYKASKMRKRMMTLTVNTLITKLVIKLMRILKMNEKPPLEMT
jgi:hypothetical protein